MLLLIGYLNRSSNQMPANYRTPLEVGDVGGAKSSSSRFVVGGGGGNSGRSRMCGNIRGHRHRHRHCQHHLLRSLKISQASATGLPDTGTGMRRPQEEILSNCISEDFNGSRYFENDM